MTTRGGAWWQGRTAALALVFLAPVSGPGTHRPGNEYPQATFSREQTAAGLKIFDDHVRDILVKECVPCHGGKHKEGELDLTTREGLLKGGLSDQAVVPGNADDSLLVWLIRHEEEPYMPDDAPKLGEDQIAHIVAWIDAGAPYSASLPKTAPPPR